MLTDDGGPIRVVQWTTGIVGSSALRAILDDPRLQLVGVFAHGAAKVGVDAGTIAGREPVGVHATDDVDALLALGADCIVYMPHWPDVALLERILRKGTNVVTTARLVNGERYPNDSGPRLRSAALDGGATLVGTGMNPMHIPTVALAATAMCRHVDKLSVFESVDCAMYGSVGTWEAYGFGGPADPEAVSAALAETEPDYPEALDVMARALGVTLDDVTLAVDLATSVEDRDLGYMRIDAGTVAGLDATWQGRVGGSVVVELRTQWTLGSIFGHAQDPEWSLLHGYRIRVSGDPNVDLRLRFAPDDFENFDIGTTTAMPAINAIPAVVGARPGVLATADLPLVTARLTVTAVRGGPLTGSQRAAVTRSV